MSDRFVLTDTDGITFSGGKKDADEVKPPSKDSQPADKMRKKGEGSVKAVVNTWIPVAGSAERKR